MGALLLDPLGKNMKAEFRTRKLPPDATAMNEGKQQRLATDDERFLNLLDFSPSTWSANGTYYSTQFMKTEYQIDPSSFLHTLHFST
jgi:hypothetical protein